MSEVKTKKVPELRFKEFEGVWESKILGKSSDFFSGGTPSSINKSYYEGNIPFIGSGNIHDNEVESFINEEGLKNSSAKLILKGDILYALYGANSGDVAISKLEGAINQAILCIRPKVDDKYFVYSLLFNNKQKIVSKYLQGGQGNLSSKIIKKLTYHFPFLPEQEKIAAFLSAVDQKIQQLQRKKELLEQYKKGMMQKLFSQEIRFKQEDGSDFPDWEEKKLGEVCKEISYGMNAASKPFDGNNIYLRITDIDEKSQRLIEDGFTSPDAELQDKFLLKKGDILFARTGASVGKSYFHKRISKKVYFAGFLIRFRVKDGFPEFIYFQTQTYRYQKWVKVMSMRSGQPGINAEEYKSFPIFYPSIVEQQKIANFLSALDEKVEKLGQQIEKAQEFKKGLLQKMFV